MRSSIKRAPAVPRSCLGAVELRAGEAVLVGGQEFIQRQVRRCLEGACKRGGAIYFNDIYFKRNRKIGSEQRQ